MNLLISLITHNRLELTQKTIDSLIKSLRDNTQVPYYLVVVDNHSTDGTRKWLKEQNKTGYIDHIILNPKNYYPGKACNIGWKQGLEIYPLATHLMRLDNDFEFYEGWSQKLEKYFKTYPKLGLLGIDYSIIKDTPKDLEDFAWRPFGLSGPAIRGQVKRKKDGVELIFWPGFVGGAAIMPRKLYDKGIKYRERAWYDSHEDYISPQEDSFISLDVMQNGYEVGYVSEKMACTIGDMKHWQEDPEYYLKSLKKRGYQRRFPKEIARLEKKVEK